ncbi:Msr family ABC-F type ribosomal protection protein [Sporosarcina pasteurii]|uniref:Uncharacterized ABC transporter ATP-binding protein YheS n=1 Tax=Sporosarcina pasteurii TaxID=1474 RepID=A0A380BLR9_SPOPA|nr:ABC-F type ribosomal protection protein [Sporosarcina pasteurii]MDS9470949.1 ABC-F type ribosomal protection protein [Sporosarcina pasteurii]QBQ05397.1 ABC-F type ribosomal protection protein [Sporosarcina pasteurii]SUJ03429.1 Uncharacterized ABC transporter ATP-binding protein YheS [Sporosarcina pasteurii]
MEKVCFELENIEVTYLDRTVLEIERLAVHQFDRIGVVGKNGAGKSTLLKLLAGLIQPSRGSVHSLIDFAYFDQLTTPEIGEIDYELIGKLSIPETEVKNYSGGEQTRLKLAKMLSNYHEGLLIDEPTTHLDAEGTQFFVDELTYYYGALVLISHDRYVLDQLVTKIWEVEDGVVTEYTGNYSDYVNQKVVEKKRQQEQHESYVKEKIRLTKAAEEKMKRAAKITQASGRIQDTKVKGNRMFETKSKGTSQKSVQRAAKALEKRVEQLEEVKAPEEHQIICFHQSEAFQLHNPFPIMADRINLKAGDKPLFEEASFQFPLGKTIAITGKNGAGKTTFLQHILQHGEGLTISPKAVIGSYEQMDYQFTKDETVLAYMKDKSDHPESRIRAVLHAMNIKGNDLKKNVRDLSGGQAIRLVLCQLFLGRYNILILDEPTNFLDIYSIEALERFLEGYEGTVILVSHDWTFIEKVADCVYSIENRKLVLRS